MWVSGKSERPDQLPDSGDDSCGNAKQGRCELAVTQTRHDEGRESDKAAVRNVLCQCEKRKQPGLDIEQTFADLVPLDSFVFQPSVILSNSVDANILVAVR